MGSKQTVSLVSPLEIKHNDMLVPVGSPKFLHNRQRFQGEVLPTSLRYEHDGWAVGKHVVELEYTGNGAVAGDYVMNRVINGNRTNYYIYDNTNESAKVLGAFTHIKESIITSTDGAFSYITDNGGDIEVGDGRVFVVFDRNTGNIIRTSGDTDASVIKTGVWAYQVKLVDELQFIDESFDQIYLPDVAYIDDSNIQFESFNNDIAIWRDNKWEIIVDGQDCQVNGQDVPVTWADNAFDGTFDTIEPVKINAKLSRTEFIYGHDYFKSDGAFFGSQGLMPASNTVTNFNKTGIIDPITTILKPDTVAVVDQAIPYWAGYRVAADINNFAQVLVPAINRTEFLNPNTGASVRGFLAPDDPNINNFRRPAPAWYNTAPPQTRVVGNRLQANVNGQWVDIASVQIFENEQDVTDRYNITATFNITRTMSDRVSAYSLGASGTRYEYHGTDWTQTFDSITINATPINQGELLNLVSISLNPTGLPIRWTAVPALAPVYEHINSVYGGFCFEGHIQATHRLINGYRPSKLGTIYSDELIELLPYRDNERNDILYLDRDTTMYSRDIYVSKLVSQNLVYINGITEYNTGIATKDGKTGYVYYWAKAPGEDNTVQPPQTIIHVPRHYETGVLRDNRFTDNNQGVYIIKENSQEAGLVTLSSIDDTGVIFTNVVQTVEYAGKSDNLNFVFNDTNLELTPPDILRQHITASNNDISEFEIVYDLITEQFTVPTELEILGKVVPVQNTINKDGQDVTILFEGEIDVEHTLRGRLPKIDDPGTRLESINNGVIIFSKGNTLFSYNPGNNQLIVTRGGNTLDPVHTNIIDNDNRLSLNIQVGDGIDISADIAGYYSLRNVTNPNVNGDVVTVDYNGQTLVFTFDPNDRLHVQYKTTHVETGEEKFIANIDAENEFTLIRQQWDSTTKTENFWWIDSEHIMVLDKSLFKMLKKQDELHDWWGNEWEDEYTVKRIDIITSDMKRYFMSNAFGGATPLFIAIVPTAIDTISIRTFDPINNMARQDYTVQFIKRDLGTKLVNNANVYSLYTYSIVDAYALIQTCKMSATVVNGFLLFGIQNTKGLDQWTICINIANRTVKTVTGYGHVGIDGTLTGGELPINWCNQIGFTGTVEPLSTLMTYKSPVIGAPLQQIIVGDANKHWYIQSVIAGIIDHINFVNGEFVPIKFALANNYIERYSSPSCKTVKTFLTGSMFTLSTYFGGQSGILTYVQTINLLALGAAGAILTFQLRYASLLYLQQNLVQGAYVWYNESDIIKSKEDNSDPQDKIPEVLTERSNDIKVEDKSVAEVSQVSSDELSFDKIELEQAVESSGVALEGLFVLMLTSAFNSLLNTTIESAVNKFQGQQSINDFGQKFGQNFLDNVTSIQASDIGHIGRNKSARSKVSALKTLDMFYSVSSTNKSCSGPGFINHNLVAHCVAQGVTSMNILGFQITGGMTVLPLLSVIKQAAVATYGGLAALGGHSDGVAQMLANSIVGGVYPTPTPAPAGMPMVIAARVGQAVCESVLNACDALESLFGQVNAQNNGPGVTDKIEKVNIDIEGKHHYGDKNMSTYWPSFGCDNVTYTDEHVNIVEVIDTVVIKLSDNQGNEVIAEAGGVFPVNNISRQSNINHNKNMSSIETSYLTNKVIGAGGIKVAPKGMAIVEGCDRFLSMEPFKNQNINKPAPVFTTPAIHDYMISESWQLGRTAIGDETVWLSVRDTKIIDGMESNIVLSDDFCGVACPYMAMEVMPSIDRNYVRPMAITPNVLGINVTGLNAIYDDKAYHAFDGYGNRIVKWTGSSGMDAQKHAMYYFFHQNDRLKRSNIVPPAQYIGNFHTVPEIAVISYDPVVNRFEYPVDTSTRILNIAGEEKSLRRYSIPVFVEPIGTLPAAIKTLSSYTLYAIEGITSLCTDIRNTQGAYKQPIAYDFTIGKELYRATNEYICKLTVKKGVIAVTDIVATIGLDFIGSTPYCAYFYSQATRQYYIYEGGTNIRAVATIERFRNVISGRWDFINQEVIADVLMTHDRIDQLVKDDEDEVDNILVPRLKGDQFAGEVWPPLHTIMNTRSWFRPLSLPAGFTYQGPNRCIINRFMYSEYMLEDIKSNLKKWKKVPREVYHPFRDYGVAYDRVNIPVESKVKGWTHNPFLLVTAPLGLKHETDCLFEWEINFAWTLEMEKIYDQNAYFVVNISGETMTPGGKVMGRPTHLFLTRELFHRQGNVGYYSFRFQSMNGAGNRERLHIWSDAYLAIASIQVELKDITNRRTEQLTIQEDVRELVEL